MMRGKEFIEHFPALRFGISLQTAQDRGRACMALSAVLVEGAFGGRRRGCTDGYQ